MVNEGPELHTRPKPTVGYARHIPYTCCNLDYDLHRNGMDELALERVDMLTHAGPYSADNGGA